MASNQSVWRTRARMVIERTLQSLSPEATDTEKRRALFDAYPFGPRAHHPYRIWREEVRAALKVLPGQNLPDLAKQPSTCRLRFTTNPSSEFNRWWLTVDCTWCDDRVKGGCLVCLPLYQRMRRLLDDRTFTTFREAILLDPSGTPALADWLEERGDDDLAEQVRLQMS